MGRPFTFKEDPLRTAELMRLLADDLERLSMFQPSPAEIERAPFLSNWRLGEPTEHLVEAPLLTDWRLARRCRPCLIGDVREHPQLGDRTVSTSELFAIDPDDRWARTFSRYYRLGTARRD